MAVYCVVTEETNLYPVVTDAAQTDLDLLSDHIWVNSLLFSWAHWHCLFGLSHSLFLLPPLCDQMLLLHRALS
jgi:hypothetical protein